MKEVIFKYAERGQFSRDQVKTILQDKFPQNSLESRQITNVMNQARREARDVIKELGGDVASILSSLQGMNDAGEGWSYEIRLDETQRVVGIWWQSAIQAQLTRRFYDILINDNAANRNIYNYPLNIGIVIDNYCKSRNAWYAVQATEDNETHAWVLKCHLNSAQKPPEVVATDRQASLISTVPTVLPLSQHIYCLYHLNGNVAQHVRPALGAAFEQFTVDFWGCYRAESPEAFDALWMQLTSTYTQVQEYLNAELYECRAKWAWAWVGQVFTAGVRTNGRVESENRVNKTLGGPKTTLLELFHRLNERTKSQSVQEMTHVRESSRRQHENNIESLFARPLQLIRQYAGPFALQTSYRQMELSLFYKTEVVQRPDGVKDWTEYCIADSDSHTFEWIGGEEQKMINNFANDNARISVKLLVRRASQLRLKVQHLLRIVHMGTHATHYMVLIPDGRYICDCCMGTNLGIPCRHYFQALTAVKGLTFHIGLIRPRWYQDPDVDAASVAPVTMTHTAPELTLNLRANPLPVSLMSNPLEYPRGQNTPAPRTQTLGARTVFQEAQTALRPLLTGVQTKEQLDRLVGKLQDMRNAHIAQDEPGVGFFDPPIPRHKGRPRTARLTSAHEGGGPRGGGGSGVHLQKTLRLPVLSVPIVNTGRAAAEAPTLSPSTGSLRPIPSRKCTICREGGHNRARCPKRII